MDILVMLGSAAVIICCVKFGLLRGLHNLASAFNWSSKARGQATGYATSIPELVTLIAAGLAGVWEAGLWNIASSNIINAGLMLIAVLRYRQLSDLFNWRFLDELGFAALAIAVPITLMSAGMDTAWYVIPVLFAFFLVYRIIDKRVNPPDEVVASAKQSTGNLSTGLILLSSALVVIVIAGVFLGNATANVVEHMGISPAYAGWILGFTTSIPEMISFFAIYAAASKEGTLHDLNDTQEVLDNLTSSNMSNVGIVYPLGLGVFLLATIVLVR